MQTLLAVRNAVVPDAFEYLDASCVTTWFLTVDLTFPYIHHERPAIREQGMALRPTLVAASLLARLYVFFGSLVS